METAKPTSAPRQRRRSPPATASSAAAVTTRRKNRGTCAIRIPFFFPLVVVGASFSLLLFFLPPASSSAPSSSSSWASLSTGVETRRDIRTRSRKATPGRTAVSGRSSIPAFALQKWPRSRCGGGGGTSIGISTGNKNWNPTAVKMTSSNNEVDEETSERKMEILKEIRKMRLFLHTPLLKSETLTRLVNEGGGGGGDDDPYYEVYVKLDAYQPSGSFKDRGMSYLCYKSKEEENARTLISSSGGNAGLAATSVGTSLHMDVKVVVPETTKPTVVEKLRRLGAEVTVHGENWNAADQLAREMVRGAREGGAADDADGGSGTAVYVSPYDNPLLWTGHSTLVDEIYQDVSDDVDVDCIVVSVGGGGLLCGVLEGLERQRRGRTSAVTVVAAETEGASSFGTSWTSGDGTRTVRLEGITSVATSLGALEVTPESLRRCKEHEERCGGARVVRESICTDAEAVRACVRFANEHRVLVEPACGASLAVLYSDRLRPELVRQLKEKGNGGGQEKNKKKAIVVEVCGGSGVTMDLLNQWEKEYC